MKKKQIVNIHEAKTHLSRLLEQVAGGDEVIIARAGHPVARLTGIASPGARALGADRGRVVIAEDFNAPLPDELLADFEP